MHYCGALAFLSFHLADLTATDHRKRERYSELHKFGEQDSKEKDKKRNKQSANWKSLGQGKFMESYRIYEAARHKDRTNS
jgi:hypothetical protein